MMGSIVNSPDSIWIQRMRRRRRIGRRGGGEGGETENVMRRISKKEA